MKRGLRSVPRTGFEPVAHSLEGCCSIQLSYRGKLEAEINVNFKNISLEYQLKSLFKIVKYPKMTIDVTPTRNILLLFVDISTLILERITLDLYYNNK